MKIHRIEVRNLNALYGDHAIDLSKDLRDAPLFLVVGPTGSGKSTLMDAICLALFGQTPRLSEGKGRDDQDARLVMSHNTAECLAVVEFSRLEGGQRVRYRAEWSCQRARKKPDGKLQKPQRSLSRLEAHGKWNTLMSGDKLQDLRPVFDKALDGLTVADFLRSVLLAQGEFSAFLRADEKARAEILERLTDTRIYKRIGERAAQLYKEKKALLEQVEARCKGLEVLSDEDRQAEEQALLEARGQLELTRQQVTWLEGVLSWQEKALALRRQQVDAQEELLRAEEAWEESAPARGRLAEALRCQPAGQQLEAVERLRAEVAREAASLPRLVQEVAGLTQTVQAETARADQARQARDEARDTLDRTRPALAEARGKWQAARQARQERLGAERRLEGLVEQRALREREVTQVRQRLQEAEASLARAQTLLTEQASAEGLVEAQAGLMAQAAQVTRLQAEVIGQREGLGRLRHELEGLVKSREARGEAARKAQVTEEVTLRELSQAQAQVLEALAGAPDVAARRGQQERLQRGLEGRLRAVKLAQGILDELVAEWQGGKAGQGQLEQAQEALVRFQEAMRQEEVKLGEATGQAERLADHVQDLKAALKLSDARQQLQPGRPCPVCGSLEHPYAGAEEGLAGFEALQEKLARLEGEEREARQGLEGLRQALRRRTGEVAAAGGRVESLEATLRTGRARLEGLLDRLRDAAGEACGQTPEPPGQGNLEALALREALRGLKEGLGLTAGTEEEAARETETEAARPWQRLDQATEAGGNSWTSDRGASGPEGVAALLSRLVVQLERALQQATESRQALEGAEKALLTAERAWSEAARMAQESRGQLQTVTAQLEVQRQRVVQAEAELTRREEESTRQTGELEVSLQAWGLPVQAEGGYRAGLEKAKALVKGWKQAREGLAMAEKQAQDARMALATAEKGLEALAQALTAAEGERRERGAVEALRQAEAEACLGGQDPEPLEQGLTRAAQGAEQAWLECDNRLQTLRNRLTGVESQLASARERLQAAGQREEEARGELALALSQLEVEDEAALRARLLSVEEQRQLTRLEQQRAEGRLSAQKQVSRGEELWQGLLQSQPAGVGWEAEDVAASREGLTEARGQADAWRMEVATREVRLKQDAEVRRSKLEAVQAREALRAEEALWKRLHELIGKGEGDEFKRFAQVLNLQDLLLKANARLSWLAPRYRLALPPKEEGAVSRLDFWIEDAYQAHEARPLTTLSGGETFLVSLSLALALADYRVVRMPVETLLLDEGFGTLDAETLNTAMDALERLQARGTQVGIISHVEALRERVEAQIVLEKVGNGRSKLGFCLGGKVGK